MAPDHQAIYMSWKNETPRGPGLWKFNNTLQDDEQYLANIRETCFCKRHVFSFKGWFSLAIDVGAVVGVIRELMTE